MRRPRGFTVVELMIAAVIALLIFGIGLMMITGASRAHSEAKARIRTNDKARMFFEQFDRDLSGAYTAYTCGYNRDSLIEAPAEVEGSCVTMTTTTEDSEAGSGAEFQSVRYYVVSATRRLCREKIRDEPLATTLDVSSDAMLCDGVERLDTSFAKWVSNNYQPATGPTDATHLLVKLTILDPNEELPPAQRLRIYQVYIPIPDGLEP